MTNKEIVDATPYLFLEDEYNNTVLVVKKEWFSDMPITDTYCDNGIQYASEYERYCDHNEEIKAQCEALGEFLHCEECEQEVEIVNAYNYWNGSNYNTIILSSEFDTRYNEITDEDEIATYVDAVDKAEHDNDYPFYENGTGYRSCDVGDFRVTESQWQGDFDIYSITTIDRD